ncbi:hypothetical protein AVEN_263121-1 [Araneus ventricosus]|uniref:Uncharacterized protein n=1 Tax=Araneus ventricosus TaxID=182803 RepID=A0A4Y2TUV8_ARAVE|nr:hypothetical protein AVEN_263121-1 [Araneus ventricosus]
MDRPVPARGEKRPFSQEQSRDSVNPPSPDSEKYLQCYLLVEYYLNACGRERKERVLEVSSESWLVGWLGFNGARAIFG